MGWVIFWIVIILIFFPKSGSWSAVKGSKKTYYIDSHTGKPATKEQVQAWRDYYGRK